MIIAVLSLLILFSYAVLIIVFIKGWSALPDFQSEGEGNSLPVTIITACKNELNHLPSLFKAVSEQTYRNFQFLLVDDGSTDGSLEYAFDAQSNFPELTLLTNKGKGKKEAIKTAIGQSDSRLIVTLDADCLPQRDWLKTIVGFYKEEFTDLVICPVRMDSDGSFLQNFQQVEFASLVGSGAGAAGADMPIFCNGANLAFRRQAWLSSLDELHFEEPGGDDVFLLQSIKKRNGSIRFLKSEAAAVKTTPVATLKEFLHQRRRWAGKKAAYSDWQLAGTALIVFLASFVLIINGVLAAFNLQWLILAVSLFLLKCLIDFSFFVKINDFFGLKNVLKNSLLFSLVYPFYIVVTAVFALLPRRNRKW